MEGSATIDSLPTEVMLRILEGAGNYGPQRLVCSSFNQMASVLLLRRANGAARERVEGLAR